MRARSCVCSLPKGKLNALSFGIREYIMFVSIVFSHQITPYMRLWRWTSLINTLRSRQNFCHFADDIFKCIFLNENVWISLTISLKCVPNDRIDNVSALVQMMAWRRPSDTPLSEPMMVRLLTHIWVTRRQWVNIVANGLFYVYLHFFCILTYAIIYVFIHHIIFGLYLYFLNILYIFKYPCTNIFHRRSLCTIYSISTCKQVIPFQY